MLLRLLTLKATGIAAAQASWEADYANTKWSAAKHHRTAKSNVDSSKSTTGCVNVWIEGLKRFLVGGGTLSGVVVQDGKNHFEISLITCLVSSRDFFPFLFRLWSADLYCRPNTHSLIFVLQHQNPVCSGETWPSVVTQVRVFTWCGGHECQRISLCITLRCQMRQQKSSI